MKSTILVALVVCAMRVSLIAQGAAMSHVFPQIADGATNIATFYNTTIIATNVNTDPATCTLGFRGVPLSRLRSGTAVTVTLATQGSVAMWETTANGPLVTGYATLTCNRPVTATAIYTYLQSGQDQPIAGATVFSSPPTMRAHLVVAQEDRLSTAIALANNTDTAGQYQLTITDLDTGQIRTGTVSVPARSSVARFVNQIVQLPEGFFGTLVISSSAGPFSVVGLMFMGNVFVSLPPTLY
jgi:hypothetical protein